MTKLYSYRCGRAALVRHAKRVRSDLRDTESDALIDELTIVHEAMVEQRRRLHGN